MPRLLSPRRAAVAGILALSALATTACSPDEWGTAARIGDQRLTVSELQQDANDVAAAANVGELNDKQRNDLQAGVLNAWVEMKLVGVAARKYDIQVTDARLDSEQAALGPADQIQEQAARSYIPPRWLRERVLQQLQTTDLEALLTANSPEPDGYRRELTEAAQQAGVDINPRYGSFVSTADAFGIKPDLGGGLASSSPQPAATGATPETSAVPAPEVAP